MKKVIAFAASLIIMLTMGITVYGYENEWDLNQKVGYLVVNGINYNYTDREESIQGVSYEPSSNTLTINNVNITLASGFDFIDYMGDIPLNVIIKGNNNIKSMGYIQDDGTQRALGSFIRTSSYNDGMDCSVNISGDGTANLDKIEYIVRTDYESWKCNISISDVTINGTNSGGIDGEYANLNIKDATIIINDEQRMAMAQIINIGSNKTNLNETDGNGTVTINNSIVEGKVGSAGDDYYGWIISCKVFSVDGCNIYAGKQSAENSYTVEQLLSEKTANYGQEYTYSTPSSLGYVLITPNKLNVPAYEQINNVETTSTKEQGTTNENNSNSQGINNSGANVKPGKVTSLKAKNIKGKKVKLTWKKVSGVAGYQILYGTNKKITKGKKSIIVKSNSRQITKLKRKKTYYFKVRAYRVSNGTKIYGAWSVVKKVKIKK